MDYKYIRAWGAMMGSYRYYIEEQIALARKDKAPTDACFKRHESEEWATFAGMTDTTKRQIEQAAENIKIRLPHQKLAANQP